MTDQTHEGTSSDEPPELKEAHDDWYYADDGVRKGPVSAIAIKDLLTKNAIDAETQIWRKGMKEWLSIRDSDLGFFVASQPPAISSYLIGNGFVWTLAILPVVYGIINASIGSTNQKALIWSGITGAPYHAIKEFPWQISFAINGLLGWLDERRLSKAGYGSNWMRAAAILLVPVYLFVRAKRLKQRPSYAVCWIVMFLLGLILEAAATS